MGKISESQCKEAADHLSEERLPVHIHRRQIDSSYVQYGGSQVYIQYWSLEEKKHHEGEKKVKNKKTKNKKQFQRH